MSLMDEIEERARRLVESLGTGSFDDLPKEEQARFRKTALDEIEAEKQARSN